MQDKLKKILRDPIWQMIGAAIGALALFVSFYEGPADRKSVSVVHHAQATVPGHFLLSEKFKLIYEGNPHEISKTFFDYYLVNNDSKNIIRPADFFRPITVNFSNNNIKIISVEACSVKYAGLYSASEGSRPSSAYVSTLWGKNSDHTWSAKPQLINPGDIACVIVVSERTGSASSDKDDFFPEWNARIAGHQLRYYKDPDAYWGSFEKKMEDYFYVGVILENFGILWFLILFSFLFFYGVKASFIAGLFGDQKKVYYRLLFISLASISTSEIVVDIYINNDGNYSSDKLHVIVWPLLVAHALFLIYVTRKALVMSRQN